VGFKSTYTQTPVAQRAAEHCSPRLLVLYRDWPRAGQVRWFWQYLCRSEHASIMKQCQSMHTLTVSVETKNIRTGFSECVPLHPNPAGCTGSSTLALCWLCYRLNLL